MRRASSKRSPSARRWAPPSIGHAWYRDLQATPLIGVVGEGFRLGLVIALAYAALAIVTTLTLTAARRARDVAFLRPLGLSARQAAGVTIVEHGVPVILAIVPGIATGIAVALLLEFSLGLEAFIGVGTPYRVTLDSPGILGVGALLGLVVAGAIVVSTWLSQRMRIVDALRAGGGSSRATKTRAGTARRSGSRRSVATIW